MTTNQTIDFASIADALECDATDVPGVCKAFEHAYTAWTKEEAKAIKAAKERRKAYLPEIHKIFDASGNRQHRMKVAQVVAGRLGGDLDTYDQIVDEVLAAMIDSDAFDCPSGKGLAGSYVYRVKDSKGKATDQARPENPAAERANGAATA